MNILERMKKENFEKFADLTIDLGFTTGDNKVLFGLMYDEKVNVDRYPRKTIEEILEILEKHKINVDLLGGYIHLKESCFRIRIFNSPVFDIKKPIDKKLAIAYLQNVFSMFMNGHEASQMELKENCVISKDTLISNLASLIVAINFNQFDYLKNFNCDYTNLRIEVLD